jgi:hypothetical protein
MRDFQPKLSRVKPDASDYPPLPLRRRLLLVLLAVATALAIVLLLIYRPGDPKRGAPRAFGTATAPAASGVGGKADVRLLPAPGASAASR